MSEDVNRVLNGSLMTMMMIKDLVENEYKKIKGKQGQRKIDFGFSAEYLLFFFYRFTLHDCRFADVSGMVADEEKEHLPF